MGRWSENVVRLTLEHVEYRNINSIRESQVNQHSGRVVFHVPAVLVAVVCVVPFVGRQQQLVQDVWYVTVDQLAMVFCVERDRRDDLQHKHEQLLKVHGTNGLSGWVRKESVGWVGQITGRGWEEEEDDILNRVSDDEQSVFQILSFFRFSIEPRLFYRRVFQSSFDCFPAVFVNWVRSGKVRYRLGFFSENYQFINIMILCLDRFIIGYGWRKNIK